MNQTHAYTINKHHDGEEWMLVDVDPRRWSRHAKTAALFASAAMAEQAIQLAFSSAEQDDIFVGRIKLGG